MSKRRRRRRSLLLIQEAKDPRSVFLRKDLMMMKYKILFLGKEIEDHLGLVYPSPLTVRTPLIVMRVQFFKQPLPSR